MNFCKNGYFWGVVCGLFYGTNLLVKNRPLRLVSFVAYIATQNRQQTTLIEQSQLTRMQQTTLIEQGTKFHPFFLQSITVSCRSWHIYSYRLNAFYDLSP
jgi:hypothetical protein